MAKTRGASLARWLVASAVVLAGTPAQGEPTLVHVELASAEAELARARGDEAYVALRRVWGSWDRADPTQVEAVLRAASLAPERPPEVRAYAATLQAYARLRRGDVGASRRALAGLGYVNDWLVVGPFDNEGKSGFGVDFGPELEFSQPIVPGRAYTGKERPVRWRPVPAAAFPFGFVDLGALLRPSEKLCAYATTFVSARDGKPRPITAWVGTLGAVKVFFNGRLVLEDPAYREHDSGRHGLELDLAPGPNNLTLKLCADDDAPVFSVRLADRKGAPDPMLQTTNDFAASESAVVTAARPTGSAAPATQPASRAPSAKPPRGPLATLRARAERAAASPADQYAYAYYLHLTGGDDPVLHVARDMARRAAEAAPKVEHLLLAGQLAEDRNQEGEWLAKAALVAPDDVRVLLAQAEHARGGPAWQDSVPFYDRILARDPDHVDAIAGRVILYNEAGLRRTALGLLERATARNPQSVNLVNMYASQLGALGRSTEAAEQEARYAALRFDDRGYLVGQVELAVARRDAATARRWLGRLREVAPASPWVLGFSSQTHRALGDLDRAISVQQEALELAPEDVATLRALSDTFGLAGRRAEQLVTLRRILELMPQDREVREYLEHLEPPKARADERYAWDPKRFLGLRAAPAQGQNRRTLRNLTVTTVFANGKSSRFHQVAFQPLTDAAAAALRQYAFQYQADREVVQLRGARVFRGDGRVDEAVESGEGAANVPEISMYTSARTFYVQLPRLEVGDVVELRYRIDDITPRNEFADYFGDVHYLQSNEPVANAEYVLVTPSQRTIHIDTNLNGLERTVKEQGGQRVHRFFAARLPPVAEEPAMAPLAEVTGYVHVSTYADWKQMARWYWGLSKDQLELDDATRTIVRELVKGARDDREKVHRVFDWVVKNTRYVALELGIYGYKPRRAAQTVARGWGDCKDKATVIVAMLRELGIDATVVIVRTQMRGGFSPKVASLAPFDHAIAYVPSLDLYLDGTAEYAGATELPAMDLEALALQVNQGEPKLVRLPSNDPTRHRLERRVKATLSADGSANVDVQYTASGQAAPEWRRLFHAKSTQRERVQSELVGKQFPGFAITPGDTGVTSTALDDYRAPVELRVRGSAPAFARREGSHLSVAVTPMLRLTPGFAALPRRKQDVRILALPGFDETYSVTLPPGMKVISAPGPVRGEGRFGRYSVELDTKPGQVVVRGRLEVTATRIAPADYPDWQRFCDEVDRAFVPRLVIGP